MISLIDYWDLSDNATEMMILSRREMRGVEALENAKK